MRKVAADRAGASCFHRISVVGSAALLAASLLAIGPRPAAASGFNPVLDEFWIDKNGSELFRDSFTDGNPPPSGPDDGLGSPPATDTYFGGGFGGFSESGGKLTIDPSLGSPCVPVTSCGGISDAIRRFGGTTTSPNALQFADSFEIHGLYDISNPSLTLPSLPGESFDIRATDRNVQGGNNNDRAGLKVVAAGSGMVNIIFQQSDFSTPTPTFTNVGSSGPLNLSLASTLELILSKAANSSDVFASYIIDGNGIQNIGNLSTFITIYHGEDLTRAEFYATSATPLPGALPLFLSGGGVLGFVGWWRKKRAAKAAA